MSEITLIVPNDWVTEEKLVEITGLRPGTIARARKKAGWSAGNTSMCRRTASQGKQRMHVQPQSCRPVG
jgi:hypothetical protein